MANSYNEYVGDGVEDQYVLTFDFIDRDHVSASVAGSPATFTWINDGLIEFDVVPSLGDYIKISRSTSPEERLVDYSNGSILDEATLDEDSLQAFYLCQESNDRANDSISKNSGGLWDSDSTRIVNVDDPVDPQDAATKAYIDQFAPDVAADAAAASASAAAALISENNSDADAAQAAADRVQTGLDRIATAADRVQTGLDRTAAATSASNSEASALSVGSRLTSTSTTSNSIGTGTKTWTTQTAKGWAVGMYAIAFRTSDPTQFMAGQVTAYNSGSGSFSMSILSGNTNGSGTYTDWTFAVSGLRGQSGISSGQLLNSGADTTLGFLDSKISVVGMTKTTLNPGANEVLQLTAITKIKQVATGTLAGDNGFASSSTSFTDTGLTASITPTSASNKILVMWSGGANYVTSGSAGTGQLRVLRGATAIDGAAGTKALSIGTSNITSGEFNAPVSRILFDSPATTSPLTYKVQAKTHAASATVKLSEFSDSFIILVEYEP